MYCLFTAGDSYCNLFTTREDDVENNDPDDSTDPFICAWLIHIC